MRLGFVSPLCAFVLLGVGACKPPSTRLDLEKIEANADDEHKGDPATHVDPLPVERAADLLPVDVSMMADASDPAKVLALFAGLSQIPELDGFRNEMVGVVGGDLLDAADWTKLGLDPHRSAGMALLDPKSTAICGWVSLSDQDVFDQTVRRIAKTAGLDRDLTVGEMAGSRVYRFNDEFNIIVRAGVAMFVVVDDPEDAPHDYAAAVATIDPRDSLGHDPGFDWARGQTRANDDGMIFIAPGRLFDSIIAAESDNDDYGVNYAEEQLATARANGADAATIRGLEQSVAQEREWQRERQRDKEAGQALARELFTPMRALVFSGDVELTRIDAQARVLMPNGGLLRDIFVPSTSQSPLVTALDEPTLFMIDGQIDVQKFLRLLDMFAKADGESLDAIDAKARAEIGISMLTSVIPLFDGRGGIALTRSKPANPKKLEDLPKTLGVAVQFGLKDADGLRKQLDDLARNPIVAKQFKSRKTGWELEIPEWRTVSIDIAGDRLIVSTDKSVAGRVRDAKPGKQALPANHLAFGSIPNPAVRYYQDWAWVALVNPPYVYIQKPEDMLYDLDAHPTLSREQATQVPQSKADKQLRKDLQKVLDDLAVIERRRAEREFNLVSSAMNEIGEIGMQLEVVPDGLTVHGLWQTRGQQSFISIGANVFAMQMKGDSSTDEAERQRLSTRSWELANEIRAQRTNDLDAFVAKQKQP